MEEEKETTAIVLQDNSNQKMLSIQDTRDWYNGFVQFTKEILKENLDFGIIPGTNKPSLYKPGAEKLRFVYGLGAEFECIDKTTDLSIPYVDYTYKCTIRNKNGQVLAQCDGNCNSMEPKFGFLWLSEHELPAGIDKASLKSKTTGKVLMEFEFAVNKGETTGQYGKPKEYWDKWRADIQSGKAKSVMKKSKKGNDLQAYEVNDTVTVYKVPNPDVVGMKNTIMKMSQKRSFVGAVLIATGASEFFTQDVEDMEINGNIHSNTHPVTDVEAEITNTQPADVKPPVATPPPLPAEKKKAPPAPDQKKELLKMDGDKNYTAEYLNVIERIGKNVAEGDPDYDKNITIEKIEQHYKLSTDMKAHLMVHLNTAELFPGDPSILSETKNK